MRMEKVLHPDFYSSLSRCALCIQNHLTWERCRTKGWRAGPFRSRLAVSVLPALLGYNRATKGKRSQPRLIWKARTLGRALELLTTSVMV